MDRVYNFNAGPSAMPLEVLQEAQAEFLNYKNTGSQLFYQQTRCLCQHRRMGKKGHGRSQTLWRSLRSLHKCR